MSEIATLDGQRAQLAEWTEQLAVVNEQLQELPGNQGLLSLKEEIEAELVSIKQTIAEILAAKAKVAPAAAPAAAPEPKRAETHQASKKADETTSEQVKYAVNDEVSAKWVSGDNKFYPARITSITGSSTDPVYTVKFNKYSTTETLRSQQIRPINGGNSSSAAASTNLSTKRKADPIEDIDPYSGSASPANDFSPIAGSSNKGVVVQKPAEKYPAAELAENDGEKKKSKSSKKIKTSKQLEKTQKSWLDFQQSSKHGKPKESQFRVPEGPKGRVGFVGSGQSMREGGKRARHVYQPIEEDN